MAQFYPIREPVIAEGQLIGHAEADFIANRDGTVTMDCRFRRNWPGWWHAIALAADRKGPDA